MTIFIKNFRKWWQPPHSISERDEDRSVTFLELFYDLVYVVLIAQLAHSLAEHVTPAGVFGFIFLFIIVWWAWLNGTTYHDLHGNNDIRTRVFTFLQMITVAAMAVFAHDALGDSSVGFALSYAAFQLILTFLWWRTGVYDPDHRPLSTPYVTAFLISTALFVISVFVPPPWRFGLWGIAVVMSLLLPLNIFLPRNHSPSVEAQLERIMNVSPSLVERFGLITIIVLGEVVVGTINGVLAHEHFSLIIGLTAVLGMTVAIGMWWIYFDFVSHRRPRPNQFAVSRWFYLHLPMTMGIAATGAAVFNVVEHAGEPLSAAVQWLLVGSVFTVLVCVALLMQSIEISAVLYAPYRRGGIVTIVMAILILILGFFPLPTIGLLLLMIALMLAPIFYGLKVWLTLLETAEIPAH